MPKDRLAVVVAWLLLGGFSSDISRAASTVVRAGAPYIIKVWETDDGLPQSSVIAMTQTRDGYLWLGTLNGLARFDGVRFTVFDEANTPGLDSSRIVSLFEDSQTNLWIGTENAGAALINGGRVISLGIGRGARERRLMAACEDAGGAVWLYTADGQLGCYQAGKSNTWNLGGFSNYRGLIPGESGTVLVGTDRSLFVIDATAGPRSVEPPVKNVVPVGKLDFLLASRRDEYWRLADGRVQKWGTNGIIRDWGAYPWSGVSVSAACEDREGNLIVGTLGAGVFWYGPDGTAAPISTGQGLSHDWVLSLCVDHEGDLWVGTDGGGLNRVKPQFFNVMEGTQDRVVQSVSEDSQGGLWTGFNAVGAAYWNGDRLQDFGSSQGLMNLNVRSMFVDRNHQVWAGTWGGLFQLQNGRFERMPGPSAIQQKVLAIHQDHGGQLWLGTQAGLVRWEEHDWKVFTTRDGLSSDSVRAIADDAEGNLWVGTQGGGLNRLRDGQFTVFTKKTDALSSDDVSSLYVDDGDVVWIGTFGSGLDRLSQGKWTRYTTREGLTSNSIGYITEDDQGYLWIGSNAGLMRVLKKELNEFAAGLTNSITCRAYGKADGLPTSECTQGSQPAACRTQAGTIWFPTIKGLVSVNPSRLKLNPYPPPVLIESVLIGGREQNTNSFRSGLLRTITVPAGNERLEIHYTSLNLAAPDRARFKYRMEGHETAWNDDANNARIARYPRLPPGEYRFEVKACNEDGLWNETGSTLAIVVLPPFWRTWSFLSATAVFLLGTIVATVHYVSTQKLQRQLEGLKHQEAIEKERSRIARDLHDQLGASLTQVSLLGELVESDKDSPGEVGSHGQQISQTARETTRVLDEIVWAVNPSNDTLDGLVTYACKYAQEYLAVAGLRYRLDVPAELPGITIPPEVRHNVFLAAKEAVTNIVRHAKASTAWIRLRLEPATFTLEIEDNGRGITGTNEKSDRNGLRNMRKRMEEIGGGFSIGPGSGGGTVVRLTAPIVNH